ncbi:MAG TPA: hydroxysqualene dehydroxylase HpnE [Jatrophihabitans sp.]|jgi:squalene-associated FAD-dependent desaturase|uniref:hydroxysqualene dehydroxylase HpnE n=1 Tax=Jatrophihabitans sp. TaxID=1932789 RepID=UPI002DFEA179|nr:hydroxysqualene dehydroxylase HpnE [Jatrophihabitans sp.]
MAERVAVVGGGLAGIAAALRLADAGREVVLLERRPRLGGMAFSFSRNRLTVDNGQHVFLRCCTAYRTLLTRLGVTDHVVLQPHLDIPVLRPDGRQARLSRLPAVPAPAHLGASLAGYGLLSARDRLRVARGAAALRRLDPTDRSLDRQALGAFLRRHGQNDATIGALWGIIATATLNLPPDEASLALAAKVFRTGLLDRADASDVGYAAVPLGRLHSSAPRTALAAAGVDVRTGCAVDLVEAGRVLGHTASGPHEWTVEDIVLAVPPRAAFGACPALAAAPAAPAAGLATSPIVNVHVVYDRRVTDLPFAAAVESPVQWFFDRTLSSGLADRVPRGQYLAVTVSAAGQLVDRPAGEITARFVAELGRLVPAAARAEVLDAFVTRERHATFRQSPGTWALRPRAVDGPPGIRLAGAWTDTGWPDTMEGAVRSGVSAAEAVLGASTRSLAEAAS